jgi:2-iminobutanoate/2-iminopropanoate deaminase
LEVFMRKRDTNRRSFLKASLAGSATVGAAAVALPATAAAGKSGEQKKVINPAGGPLPATALFSPATQLGNLLFVSGNGALDPQTHNLVPGGFTNQVKQSLENVKAVLVAAGSSMDKVLKCNVFLAEIQNFAAMNEVYHTYFPVNPPARTTVAVKDLPHGTPIEIECIAYV